MPRPKRTKIVGNYAKTRPAEAPSAPVREHNKQTDKTSDSFGDDSDELVRRSTRPSVLNRKSLDVNMAGGLGAGDVRNAHVAGDQKNKMLQRVRKEIRVEDAKEVKRRSKTLQSEVIDEAEQIRRQALGRWMGIGEVLRVKEAGKRISGSSDKRPVVMGPGSKDVKAGKLSRPSVTLRRSIGLRESSDNPQTQQPYSVESSVDGDEDRLVERVTDSFPALQQTIAPPSAHKQQVTPSFISISNFKRRPRQPSILRMVQQSLSKKNQPDSQRDNLNNNEEDSTLLTLDNSRISTPENSAPASPRTPHPRSSSSRKRKLSALEEQDPQARSTPSLPPPTTPHRRDAPDPPSDPAELLNIDLSHIEVPASSYNSPEANNQQASSPTNATPPHKTSYAIHTASIPPRKSSAVGTLTKTPTRKAQRAPTATKSHKPHRRVPVEITTDASSPLSTPTSTSSRRAIESTEQQQQQQQPAKKTQQGSAAKKKPPASTNKPPKSLTTAALQALLPRRRPGRGTFNRGGGGDGAKDDFDILSTQSEETDDHSSSSEEEDEEEESDVEKSRRLKQRRKRKRVLAAAAKGSKRGAGAVAKSKAKGRKPLAGRSPGGVGNVTPKARKGKTYSRPVAAEEDDDDEVAVLGSSGGDENDGPDEIEVGRKFVGKGRAAGKKSREIAEAARKFEEVDEWELSFESCDFGTRGSSPWR